MNCDKFLPRNAVCEKVLRKVKRILKPEHDFGERFSQSSENLKLIKHAFMEDKKFQSIQRMRNQSKPTNVSRSRRIIQDPREPVPSDHVRGGFKVDIKSHMFDKDSLEEKYVRVKWVLTWSEPRADVPTEHDRWIIGPISLSDGVMDQPNDRYAWYTPEGLDIRNQDNVPLEDRVPVRSSNFQGCTSPIPTIVLQTKVDSKTDQVFLSELG
jgi:hypothetical protein